MRIVLEYYTRDSKNHPKLIQLYENAIEKFRILSQQYASEKHFAKKVVKDLIDEGYHQGKKITYYNEHKPDRKDPLELDISDANKFIKDVVEPFLDIIGELTDDR